MVSQYEIADGKLRWFDVLMTTMACPDDSERWFLDFMHEGVEATMQDGNLALTRDKTQVIFKQVP